MKKYFLAFGILLLLVCCFCIPVQAADVVASGYCGGEGDGTNLTWTLDSEGTLTSSGTGAMADYWSVTDLTWYPYQDQILTAVLEDGVTNVGHYALYYCQALTSAVVGDDVTAIAGGAFQNCTSLVDVQLGSHVERIGD